METQTSTETRFDEASACGHVTSDMFHSGGLYLNFNFIQQKVYLQALKTQTFIFKIFFLTLKQDQTLNSTGEPDDVTVTPGG